MDVTEYVDRQSRLSIVPLGFIILAIVGLLDYLSAGVSFTLLYLIPVFLVTWFVGTWAGVMMSFASAGVCFIACANVTIAPVSSGPMIWNALMELGIFLVVTALVASLQVAQGYKRVLEKLDQKTGIFSKQYFMELANNEINRSRRYDHPFTFVCIDIPELKAVDNASTRTGGKVLRSLAGTIQKSVRSTDIVARLDGIGFGVLCPETGNKPASVVLEKLRERINDSVKAHDTTMTLTIGAITFKSPPESAAEMLSKGACLINSINVVSSPGLSMVRHEVFSNTSLSS